jgi:hypothetical protein
MVVCVSQQAILHPAPIRHPAGRQSLVKMACAGVAKGSQVQSSLAECLSRPSSGHDQVVGCGLVKTLACHRSGGTPLSLPFLRPVSSRNPFFHQLVNIFIMNSKQQRSILPRPERPLWVLEAPSSERCLVERGTVGRRYHQDSPLPRTFRALYDPHSLISGHPGRSGWGEDPLKATTLNYSVWQRA